MSFAENIKNARLFAGMTQQQLADKLGLDRTEIVKYERGLSNPKLKNIQRICDALNVSVDQLLKD